MEALRNSIKTGLPEKVEENLKCLIEKGQDAQYLLDNMIESLREVGDAFSKGDAFIPEMLVAARAMEHGARLLDPLLRKKGSAKIGEIIMATVQGDLHDVGKNIVSMMLQGVGFNVIDLGVDINPNKLIEAFEENKPDIVGLSAMLTTTMVSMKNSVNVLKTKFPHSIVIVGGAPITDKFNTEIGADGYAEDAGSAVKLVSRLMGI